MIIIIYRNEEIDIKTIIKIPNSLSDTSFRSLNTSNYHMHSFKSMTISSNRSKLNNEIINGNHSNLANTKSGLNHENITIMNLNLDTNNLREQQVGSHVLLFSNFL